MIGSSILLFLLFETGHGFSSLSTRGCSPERTETTLFSARPEPFAISKDPWWESGARASHTPRSPSQHSSTSFHSSSTSSMQFMITHQMKKTLIEDLRYTRQQVHTMCPQRARNILAQRLPGRASSGYRAPPQPQMKYTPSPHNHQQPQQVHQPQQHSMPRQPRQQPSQQPDQTRPRNHVRRMDRRGAFVIQ